LNPDDSCLALGMCVDPKCRMYPKHYSTSTTPSNMYKPPQSETDSFPYLSSWWKEILRRLGLQQLIETFKTHLPYYDSDKDRFSGHLLGDLRGFSWRGKDCDDKNVRIYPGRKTPV
jgi:acyloxyacyl hydrolase